MKRLLIASTALALAATTIPAVAADDNGLLPEKMLPGSFSANVAVVSEYLFRGLSQTQDEPAIQGGFDWALDSKPVGVYAGTWLSNVNFQSATGNSLEWDLYGGVQGEFRTITWKLGGIWYHYPTAPAGSDFDYGEIAAQLGHDFGPFSATYSFNYSPDYFGGSGDGVWNALNVSVPIGKVTLGLWGGHQSIDHNEIFLTPDYYTYGVSLAAKIFGFDTTVAFQDTDISKANCFPTALPGGAPTGLSGACGPTVTLMVARSF
jgi:uncharacterized protein (TIGR02001 family)